MDGVVPSRANRMGFDVEGIHFLVRHLNTYLVRLGYEMSLHGQAGLGRGIPDVVKHTVIRAQGTTRPRLADLTEQTVLDRVPLRSARWVMADGHGQTEGIRHLDLQVSFPHAGTVAIAPATIRFDHQLGGLRVVSQAFGLAPVDNVVHRKAGCIGGLTDIDRASVMLEIVDAIRNCTTHGILPEIVYIDRFWRLAPHATWVLEVANQLFLLGIHTQHGLSCMYMLVLLVKNVPKLLIPFGLLFARQLLDIGP